MINLVLKLFLVLTISKQFNAEQKQYDDKKCLELGYRKTELQCDKCSELVKFDLNDLKEDCEACCTISNEEKTIKKTYKNARLEICNCKLGNYYLSFNLSSNLSSILSSNLSSNLSSIFLNFNLIISFY